VEAQRQIRAQASLAVVTLVERQTTAKARASSAAVTPEEIHWVLLAQLAARASTLVRIRADNRQCRQRLSLVEQVTLGEAVCLAM